MGLFETKVQRLKKWAKGERAPPLSLELVPTDKCNLNCRSCWRQNYSEEELEEKFSDEMSDERLLKLIDEAAELDVREVIFVGGGEPLSREIVPKLIEKIKDYGMEGDLVTNGTLVTKEKARLLVNSGWNRIKFSVDGPDPEVHDDLRGKEGAFAKTIDNIKYISQLREEKDAEYPKLYFNTVVSKRNYDKLPEMVRLADKLGIDGIQLLPTTAFSESSEKMQLSPEETEELMEIIEYCISLSEGLGITENNFSEYSDSKYISDTESMHKIHMEELKEQFSEEKLDEIIEKEYYRGDQEKRFKYLPCYAPWHHITIRPNGNIAPCFSPWVWETDLSIKDRKLEKVWFGDKFNEYRNTIKSGELPEQCKRCCVWEVFKNREIRKELNKKGLGDKLAENLLS